MSEAEILGGLFVLALLFGVVGWVAFVLALMRTRHAIEEADKLACRVVDQGEELARLRWELDEVKQSRLRGWQMVGALTATRKVWPGPSTGEEASQS